MGGGESRAHSVRPGGHGPAHEGGLIGGVNRAAQSARDTGGLGAGNEEELGVDSKEGGQHLILTGIPGAR